MGHRFAWIAGVAGIALALARLDRLIEDAETGLPWVLALVAAALLGGLITWIALAYRTGLAGAIGANLLFFSLAAVRIGAPEGAIAGVLPTWTSFETLSDELGLAIDVIRFGAPPVPPLAGLLVILAAIFWGLGAMLSYGLASGRPAVALVPPLLFYLQLATIDRLDPGDAWIVAAMVIVIGSFLAVAFDERRMGGRLRTSDTSHQLASTTTRLPLVFVALPAALALFAIGAFSGRVDEAGLIGWRRGGLGAGGVTAGVSYNLFTDSIQQGLVADSDRIVFRADVTGDVDPSTVYFRMVTLDRYDGRNWYPARSARKPPPEGQPWGDSEHVQAGTSVTVSQDVEIEALSMNVLPALATPQDLETSVAIIAQGHRLTYDGAIWLQARTRRGNTYRVTSEVTVPDVAALATVSGRLSPIFAEAQADGATDVRPRTSPFVAEPSDIEDFLELPDDVHPAIRQTALELTEEASTSYEQGLILERFFLEDGEFSYATQTEGHGASDLADWLFDPLSDNYRTGYCEQFATALGVMARSIGIPSRVVLGFTPGDVSGNTVTVREKHGHAWVELWIEGHGWVQFDPTPRADGQNAPTTMSRLVGFDPAEHVPPPAEDVSEGEPPQVTQPGALRDILDEPFAPIPAIVLPGTSVRVPLWIAGIVALAIVMLIIPGVKWLRRRRRLERLRNGDIGAAWVEITDRLTDLGSPVPAHQTPLEVARQTDSSLGPLAHEYGRSAYGPGEAPGSERISVAERSFQAVEAHLRTEYELSKRAWAWIRPGSLRRRR